MSFIFPRSLPVLVLVTGLVILRTSNQLNRYDRPYEHESPQWQGNILAAPEAPQNENPPEYDNASLRLPVEGCLDLNSREWVDGPRYGNEGLQYSSEYASQVLTQPISDSLARLLQASDGPSAELKGETLPMLLSQSLCHESSRFRAIDRNVRSWTTRLIYLAMTHHQQRHSLSEALLRFTPNDGVSKSCQTHLQQEHGVGMFDFECHGAKFIVASLADIGLGANVRGGMIEALLAGLVSDRVVLFVNNAKVGHKFLRKPWALVSCPRRDYQCFFFPLSPCVLSHKDIIGAYRLTKAEAAELRSGKAPIGPAAHEKVWQLTLSFTPQQQIPLGAAERLYNHSMALLQPLLKDESFAGDPRRSVLVRAARQILQRNESRRAGYNYGAANLPIHHALAVFSTRPNLHNAQRLLDGVDASQARESDETISVGLPIRASDKCERESECLSFQDHLQAASLLLRRHHGMSWPSSRDGPQSILSSEGKEGATLLVTTESLAMVDEIIRFKTNQSAQSILPYNFDIRTNERDVTPDTGYIPSLLLGTANVSFTADEALLSAVSSLQHQLAAQVTIGNCCSNFHVLLADLLAAGCGAAANHTFHCLQEHEDPHYRVCCGWFRNCKEEKRLAIERMELVAE